MGLAELSRKVRRSLGLTQEEFAAKLEAAGSTVRNWESGRKRPAPEFLKKMIGLAPAFAREISEELSTYEWHQGAARSGSLPFAVSKLNPQIREAVEMLAKSGRIPIDEIYAELITLGLQAHLGTQASTLSRSRPSPKELGAKVLRDLKVKREAYARTTSKLHRKPA